MPGGDLPSGTVTFLFTDIEGSTKLFRALGDAYPPLLNRHNELLRKAWGRHGGHEVKTEGDAFFVAFSDTGAAIAACVDAQRALGTESWPGDFVFRVRMGLHSGLAVPRDGDYIAFAVHQAARVVGTAHGGQIVISSEAAREARVPVGADLRSLGRYRLRDFDEAVELFQVAADGLQSAFPALRAIPADGHNLIRPRTSFVGRDSDLHQLAELLQRSRLVSVVGPGGIGKTRLVVEYGCRHALQWDDGVWMVQLANIDSGLVAAHVAEALGVGASQSATQTAVGEHLANKCALVILDNCEHVTSEVADLASTILDASDGTAVLTTTREPLNLGEEHVWRPDPLGAEGKQLFLDRARAINSRFEPTRSDQEAIAQVCEQLDGLPLAIELAAARAEALTPTEILGGLQDRLLRLRSRRRDLDERHRSLESLLDWSYGLLESDEQAVVRRLSVFTGSFGMSAAEAASAWGSVGDADVAEVIWSLVDKSLVVPDPSEGETRYRMLQTVRSYMGGRLNENDEHRETVAQLGGWLVDNIGPQLNQDTRWLYRLRVEVDNIRGAIAQLSTLEPSTAQALACSLALLHDARGTYLESADEVGGYVRMLRAHTPERLALLGVWASSTMKLTHELPRTAILEVEELTAAGLVEPRWCRGRFASLGALELILAGDYERAAVVAREALAADALNPSEQLLWQNVLGVSLNSSGSYSAAVGAFKEQLLLARQLGDFRAESVAQVNLAEAHLRLKERPDAARAQLHALELAAQSGNIEAIAYSLIVAAHLEADKRDWDRARELHARADAILGLLGLELLPDDRARREELMRVLRLELGPGRLDESRQDLLTTDLEDDVALAERSLTQFIDDI